MVIGCEKACFKWMSLFWLGSEMRGAICRFACSTPCNNAHGLKGFTLKRLYLINLCWRWLHPRREFQVSQTILQDIVVNVSRTIVSSNDIIVRYVSLMCVNAWFDSERELCN